MIQGAAGEPAPPGASFAARTNGFCRPRLRPQKRLAIWLTHVGQLAAHQVAEFLCASKQAGWRKLGPRPRHPKAQPRAQEHFKRTPPGPRNDLETVALRHPSAIAVSRRGPLRQRTLRHDPGWGGTAHRRRSAPRMHRGQGYSGYGGILGGAFRKRPSMAASAPPPVGDPASPLSSTLDDPPRERRGHKAMPPRLAGRPFRSARARHGRHRDRKRTGGSSKTPPSSRNSAPAEEQCPE